MISLHHKPFGTGSYTVVEHMFTPLHSPVHTSILRLRSTRPTAPITFCLPTKTLPRPTVTSHPHPAYTRKPPKHSGLHCRHGRRAITLQSQPRDELTCAGDGRPYASFIASSTGPLRDQRVELWSSARDQHEQQGGRSSHVARKPPGTKGQPTNPHADHVRPSGSQAASAALLSC